MSSAFREVVVITGASAGVGRATARHGARGQFSHVARDYSIQQWISRNRGWLALACVVAGGWALSRRLNKGNYRQLVRRRFSDGHHFKI